jgi:hypothetical protein
MTTPKPKVYSYIRFSTPSQKLGDSLRRQLKSAEKFAERHGLELDTTLNLRDEGLSGFHGRHIDKGALGRFLELIQIGKIPTGSYLTVESIDRLGRQEPFEALDNVKKVIDAGITLVVNEYGMEEHYTHEIIRSNPGKLSGLIHSIERAYFESKRKSDMLKEAWGNKRALVEDGIKTTAMCPAWLEPQFDNNEQVVGFTVKEEVADVVRRIYNMSRDGFGTGRIEQTLNMDKTIWSPPISKRNKTGGWRQSYIVKILKNPAVTGEHQLYRVINKKRVPIGEPIPNYYPPIVDKELYLAVKQNMEEIRNRYNEGVIPGGNTGKASNLFTSLVRCADCGGVLHFQDKGAPPKGNNYLRCDNSARKLLKDNGERVCTIRPIPYREFEKVFFKYMEEVNLSDFMPGNEERLQQIESLDIQLMAKRRELGELGEARKKLMEVANLVSMSAQSIATDLKRIDEQSAQVRKRIEELERKLSDLRNRGSQMIENRNQIVRMSQLMDSIRDEQERIAVRTKLRTVIRQMFTQIRIKIRQDRDNFKQLGEEIEPGIREYRENPYMEYVWVKFSGEEKHTAGIHLDRYTTAPQPQKSHKSRVAQNSTTDDIHWSGGVPPGTKAVEVQQEVSEGKPKPRPKDKKRKVLRAKVGKSQNKKD